MGKYEIAPGMPKTKWEVLCQTILRICFLQGFDFRLSLNISTDSIHSAISFETYPLL
jgi:hypothetical protein